MSSFNTNTSLVSSTMNNDEIDSFEEQLRDIQRGLEMDFPYTVASATAPSPGLTPNSYALSEQERNALIAELHHNFRMAKDAILNCQRAVERIRDVNMKEASRAAVEGCLIGLAASRGNPIGAIIGSLVGSLLTFSPP